MTLDLSITTTKKESVDIISLQGELDDFHAPKLIEVFNAIIDKDGGRKLIVNLDQTTFIDSVGLGTIANAAKKLESNNGKIQIICAKEQIVRLLAASGLVSALHRTVGIAEDETTALQELQ